MAVKPTYNDNIGLPEIHYNPLQNYRNATYNTRLTMMPVTESTNARPERKYDYKKGIVLWETGGTGTVFLEELTMHAAGTGNKSGDYLTQMPIKFTGKLVEPIGGRLIEAISLAAMQLGYANNGATYLFEISFVGTNTETDLPETCRGWQDEEMIFRWYITINELKMKLDYKGSVYDFEFMPSDASATLSDFTRLEQGFRMDGKPETIGDFCKQLAEALNKREAEKVKSGMRCEPHKYVITAHKDIANLKYSYGMVGNFAAKWGMFKGEIQAQPGTSIQTFILGAMPNSEEVLKFLHQIPKKKDFNSPDTKPNTAEIAIKSFAIIPGCKDIAKGKLQAYDPKLGAVAKEVHYFITTREDGRNAVSPQEYKDAQDPSQRDKRVQNWISKGLLRKVYKWIYTGENTEVINADIKIDFLWRNVRPLWINKDGKPIAATATQPTASKKSNASNNSKVINCNDAREVQPGNQTNTIYYAEDMPYNSGSGIDPKPGWYPHMPQFQHVNTTVDQASSQSAVYQESAQEYSIYRQVANNQAASGDMFNLELDVVGDPFWLLQVPGAKGGPPWTDDVWEYEAKQLTEETMAEKRKSASTHTWLSYIYFEAQVPSADNDKQDRMALRKSDAVSGVYSVIEITNKFTKGRFTTHLKCVRENLSNPWVGKMVGTPVTASGGQKNASGVGPKTAGTSNAKEKK